MFNRLCDPDSKLGVLRWLETVAVPGVQLTTVTPQHLLRRRRRAEGSSDRGDNRAGRLGSRPMIDQDLAVVFYDRTPIRAEGSSTPTGDVRPFGMAKEGVFARQFLLGVVQTAEGLPIDHPVVDGHTAKTTTLLPTLSTVLTRFPVVRRVIWVADRGLARVWTTWRPCKRCGWPPGRRWN